MIEAIVSAALLLIVSISVFLALDQGDRLSGQQARRAIAANLAEAEIERIRALPIEDVANLRGVARVVKATNNDYTVSATSKWVTDGTDEPECSTRSGGLDYMRVTTKVAWNKSSNYQLEEDGTPKDKFVQLSSIVTPAARAASDKAGSLSVHIVRADGVTGVSGLDVTIKGDPTGPTYRETTNENGCVVFPFVNAQDYVLSFQRTGWVNQDSVSAVEDNTKVAAGQTSKMEYLYDQGGTTAAEFITAKGLNQNVPSYPDSFVLFHTEQRNPIVLTFDSKGDTTNRWDGKDVLLFPFKSPYAIYAGSYCANGGNAPTSGGTYVNIPPGGQQNAGTVRLPAYDVQANSGTGSLDLANQVTGGAKVVYNSGCGANIVKTTEADGRLKDPGFPWTTSGSVCVSGRAKNGTTRKVTRSGTTNTAAYPLAPPLQPFYLSGSTNPNVSSTGPC